MDRIAATLDIEAARFDFSAPAGVERGIVEPFGFDHNLHALDVFSDDSLKHLAAKYVDRDFFVAGSAVSPETEFYGVPSRRETPLEAINRLDTDRVRILLKRPERYDARFRKLLDTLFAQVVADNGGTGPGRIVRLDSSVFITSAQSITPFHFDPEVTYFSQIVGAKTYHVFSPTSVAESDLERFYVKGIVDIGQVHFDQRNRNAERVFELGPGSGLFQPQNAPHWVELRGSHSVSYAFSFETDVMRERNRTRSFNYYERLLGIEPARLGQHSRVDAIKARSMDVAIPARKALRAAMRRAIGR